MTANPQVPLLSESALIAYGEEVARTYQQAECHPLSSRTFVIGACAVRVVSPNAQLLGKLTNALSHLPSKDGNPDLTICLWDGDPAPLSPLAWYARQAGEDAAQLLRAAPLDARGELPQFNSQRIRTTMHVHPSKLCLFDVGRSTAYYWISDAGDLPSYEESAPFHDILSWGLNQRGQTIVHAGAAGLDDGGVLFVGGSGTGKSTCALACLTSPLGYAGDDYCLVASEPAPRVYSLYNSAKLKSRADFVRFPTLAAYTYNLDRIDHEKALMFIDKAYPQKMLVSFPLRALIIPRIVGASDSHLHAASPTQVLQAIAPSSVSQQPGTARRVFLELARLTQQVPGYIMEIGEDVTRIPLLVLQLLEETINRQ